MLGHKWDQYQWHRHYYWWHTGYHRLGKSLLTRLDCCSWSSLSWPDLFQTSNYRNNETYFLAVLFSSGKFHTSFHYTLTTIPSLTAALAGKISLYLKRKLSSKISSLECLRSLDLMLKILGQDFLL